MIKLNHNYKHSITILSSSLLAIGLNLMAFCILYHRPNLMKSEGLKSRCFEMYLHVAFSFFEKKSIRNDMSK